MPDKYSSFAALAAAEKPDAFSILVKDQGSALVIAAPHGGAIEPGTSEIATAIAGNDHSLYLFEGKKAAHNVDLHITSTRFDEPQYLKLVQSAATVLTVHGEASTSQAVFLGGRDASTRKRLEIALKGSGFDVRAHDDPDLQGLHPANICNRGQSGIGVQLEISRGLRQSFFRGLDAAGRAMPTEGLKQFASAINEGLKGGYWAHDDLIDPSQGYLTYKFCCPIFISGTFGTLLTNKKLVTQERAEVRNGTLTFVAHRGDVYGITCRHVVEALEHENEDQREHWHKVLGSQNAVPSQAQVHFFVPRANDQIHINARFHKAPGDEFTGDFPDLAIARIQPQTLTRLDRRALLIPEIGDEELMLPLTCCVATGYPEANREIRPINPSLGQLAVAVVTAAAPVNRLGNDSFTMYAELPDEPVADNMSGMSGGPIVWSSHNKWGLAGIVKEGRDMRARDDPEAIVKAHVIWIEGQRIRKDWLVQWIESLPPDEPTPDLSKQLIRPSRIDNG